MNSKAEFNGSKLPRILVEVGDNNSSTELQGEKQDARRVPRRVRTEAVKRSCMSEVAQECPDEVTEEEKPSPAKRARGEVPQQDGFKLVTLSSGTQFPSVPVQSNRNAVLLGVVKPISCGVLFRKSQRFPPGALHTNTSPHPKEQKVG